MYNFHCHACSHTQWQRELQNTDTVSGLLWKLLVGFSGMADDLAGHGLVVVRVGSVSQSGGVQQTEAEPLVDPVAGAIHAPAWIVTERRRL